MNKKLTLHKELIATLGYSDQSRVYGGGSNPPVPCDTISQIAGSCPGCPPLTYGYTCTCGGGGGGSESCPPQICEQDPAESYPTPFPCPETEVWCPVLDDTMDAC